MAWPAAAVALSLGGECTPIDDAGRQEASPLHSSREARPMSSGQRVRLPAGRPRARMTGFGRPEASTCKYPLATPSIATSKEPCISWSLERSSPRNVKLYLLPVLPR